MSTSTSSIRGGADFVSGSFSFFARSALRQLEENIKPRVKPLKTRKCVAGDSRAQLGPQQPITLLINHALDRSCKSSVLKLPDLLRQVSSEKRILPPLEDEEGEEGDSCRCAMQQVIYCTQM